MDFTPVFNENWPIYFKDRLILSNSNSSNSIVTLWTPKETIQKLAISENYSVLGQLYTKKGINFIIRNILAYPKTKKIYIVGNDLMESGKALTNFFENGVDENYKIVGDDFAVIEKEIPLEAINDLRNNVVVIDYSGPENIKKVSEIKTNNSDEFWRKPEVFPEPPTPEISAYPSEIDLTKIRRPTIAEAYLSVLKHIMKFGLESEPVINYASDTSKTLREMLNLTVVVTDEDPDNFFIPDYMPFSKKDVESYMNGFFDPEKHTEDYTYGERLFNYADDEIEKLKEIYPWLKLDRFKKYYKFSGYDQVEISIIRKLSSFRHDKGAIALLANPFEDVFPQRPPKKTPCLFLIQCQIYQNKLNMTAYFRSNDMFSAWPLNAFALRKLQDDIAEKLDCELGNLITISNMAHIYEHNYTDADNLYKKYYKGICEYDPRGNFQISVDKDKIIVKLMTPRGNELLKEWIFDGKEFKVSERILFTLIEDELALSVLGNAGDLGIQISRAEIAIKMGIEYLQDNPLNLENKST